MTRGLCEAGYAIASGLARGIDVKAHMASLRGRFHKVLTAAPQVEKAGRGKYRARFAGFDHDDARQACQTLLSKGVHCMVVAGS